VASPASHKTIFTFGVFEADPECGELRRQGRRVHLQDQPFHVLLLLLERPGEVITREVLREKLWPQNTFVEFDNGLYVAVKKLRNALHDGAGSPRFIETIPRRGYRFIAPVSIKMPAAEAPAVHTSPLPESIPANSEPLTPTRQNKRWRKYISFGAGILTVAVAAVILLTLKPWARYELQAPTPPVAVPIVGRRVVAVMEFQNMSSRKGDDWFSTAISEMLATELGAGEQLHLIPAEDVIRMKRELHVDNNGGVARETAVRAGKNLNADMLVSGSFTVMGAGHNRRVRVDVRMQELSHGEIVAEVAETADEQHVFELAERAGTRLREAMGVPGTSLVEQAAVRAALPSSPVASRLYAEGLARLRIAEVAGARDLLEQAVAAEPGFPLSHLALASAWRALGYEQKATAEAKRAFDLSSHLPRAEQLLIEGRYYHLSGDMDKAISAYRALFALFPDNLEDGLSLAESQIWGGKPGDALATLESLRHLPEPMGQDPRIDLRQASALSALGRTGGLEYLKKAEEKAKLLGAPLLAAKAQIGECLTWNATAQYEEGARACEAAYSTFVASGNPTDTAQSLRHLGDARQSQGRLDEALDLYEKALKINRKIGDNTGVAVSLNQMAILYETRGDLNQAGKLYRESYALFLKVGHHLNAAMLAANVGGILLQQGKLAQAEQIIEESMNLAHKSSFKGAQAQAHKAFAEVALLRGEFAQAREHIESAHAITQEGGNVSRYEYLMSLSRILAAQNDLAGARRDRVEALALAEKIGAKSLAAQSRLAVAELDLHEAQPVAAEQRLRDALAAFRSEKMRDDEVEAQAALSRCLLMQHKNKEAEAALAEARTVAAYSQNPAVHLTFAIADARVKAASTATSRTPARTELLRSIQEAHKLGFIPLQYEARLALAELSEDSASAKKNFESLEHRAHEHGLELIAEEAARLRIKQR